MKTRFVGPILAAAAFAALIGVKPVMGWARENGADNEEISFVQRFDQNGDDLISLDEFPGDEDAFNRLDTNSDGNIDETEAPPRPPRGFPGVKEMVAEFDADGDGLISAEEFPGPEDHFEMLDVDGDGLLSVDELAAPGFGPPPGHGFESDDTDQDGMVSQAEFSGPEELFNRLDADGDGYITREEARANHPHGRQGRPTEAGTE